MMTLEGHTEVHVREQAQCTEYSCCRACHRMFHAKSVDQLSVGLCDKCFDFARGAREAVPQVHVKLRPRKRARI